MTLAEFLLARIAEDEETAQAATAPPWRAFPCRDDTASDAITSWTVGGAVHECGDGIVGACNVAECCDPHGAREDLNGRPYPAGPWASANATHIARWDPARVLAECAAKRAIVELHGSYGRHRCPYDADHREYSEQQPCRTLRLLALPYATHPDYRPEWAPAG